MIVLSFAAPAQFSIQTIKKDGIEIYFPKVIHLKDKRLQRKINLEIVKRVDRLIDEQYEQQGASAFTEMIGTFEVKTNERNILSIFFVNYAFAEFFAHGLTLVDSLTIDLNTGEVYQLKDLFKVGTNYVEVLSETIRKQIKKRSIETLNSFHQINKDQSFYIADKSLVIYFQAYDITPGYVGIPMFPINGFFLEDILKEKGALGRLLPSTS